MPTRVRTSTTTVSRPARSSSSSTCMSLVRRLMICPVRWVSKNLKERPLQMREQIAAKIVQNPIPDPHHHHPLDPGRHEENAQDRTHCDQDAPQFVRSAHHDRPVDASLNENGYRYRRCDTYDGHRVHAREAGSVGPEIPEETRERPRVEGRLRTFRLASGNSGGSATGHRNGSSPDAASSPARCWFQVAR
jgi:hypothetical protein